MKKALIQQTDILGEWISEDQDSKIRIYASTHTGCFNGKITWIIGDESNPDGPILDKLNPNDSLQQRTISGIEFITGLSFNDKKKQWQNGKIYNPKDGKTYNLKVWFLNENTLNFRPSMDAMSLLGQNFKWCRLSI